MVEKEKIEISKLEGSMSTYVFPSVPKSIPVDL